MRGYEHQSRRASLWACAAGGCALLLALTAHADPFVRPVVSGRQLMVGSAPFQLRSFAYSPVPIGENPSSGTSTRYTDPRLIRRDGPLMTAAGANGIRIFDAMSIKLDGTGELHTNVAFIREAALQGLWVVMGTGFPCNLDFANATVRANVVQAHVDLAAQFGAEPNVLMWAPGNEMNLAIPQNHHANWYSLLEAIASAVKTAQGPGGPLLCGINGDVTNEDDVTCANSNFSSGGATAGMTIATSVDVWAVNLFRGASLGTLREELLAAPAKPYWIAEMGTDSFNNDEATQDEATQAAMLEALWDQIHVFDDVLSGGDMGFWSDEWWKCGFPGQQDNCGNEFGGGSDNFMNEEHLGAMKIATGDPGEVDLVIPKQAYDAVQDAWAEACPNVLGPEPFLADFDAGTSNNYAGFTFGQQTEIGVPSGNTASGASGGANDFALHVAQLSVPGSATYIIAVLTLFPNEANRIGYDFSAFDTLSFDVSKGTSTAFGSWRVRLEDSDPGDEFLNDSVALPALTTSFQHVEIPLTNFTVSTPVDLTRVAQIVFAAVLPGSRPPSFEVDFILDNVRIYDSSAPTSCNRAPTGIALSPSSVTQGVPDDTVVGTFSTTDPDVVDTHTYTITADPSNGGFGLSGADLVVADTTLLTGAQSPYRLSVRSDDDGSPSLSVERYIDVQVICPYQISPVGANHAATSGNGSVQATAGTGCAWTATAPGGSFVTITSGSSGTGNGTVQYSFTANGTGSLRSTTLTIAGKSFTVSQNASGVSMTLAATASSSQVALSWSAAAGATSYVVLRSENNAPFNSVTTTSNLLFSDASVVAGTGYRYQILAQANGPVSLGLSNVELVVPFAWIDPSLGIGTVVKAAHLTELRSAINAARGALGWQALTFSGTIAAGQTVLRSHLVDLRAATDAVRAGAGMVAVSYTDPTVTVSVTKIRATHILELRAALQ